MVRDEGAGRGVHPMDTDLLHTFIQVAQTGSFRAAAAKLYVTQSAVSARIRLLEDGMGVALFDRNKHGATLTVAGSRLLQHAEKILSEWHRCCQEVILPADAQAMISVGAVDSLWSIYLRGWLSQMRDAAPELAVHAEISSSDELLPQLLNGSYDIVLVFESARLPPVASVKLATIPMVMVASRKKVTVAKALEERYISINWSPEFSAIHHQLFPQERTSKFQTSIGRVALDVLLDSGGAGYFPRPLILPYLERKQLFPVDGAPEISRPVNALYLPERDDDPFVRQALTALKEVARGV